MDARITKIQVTPTKFDDDKEIVKDRFATLTFEVPLLTVEQREALAELMDLTAEEYVIVTVDPHQLQIPDSVAA